MRTPVLDCVADRLHRAPHFQDVLRPGALRTEVGGTSHFSALLLFPAERTDGAPDGIPDAQAISEESLSFSAFLCGTAVVPNSALPANRDAHAGMEPCTGEGAECLTAARGSRTGEGAGLPDVQLASLLPPDGDDAGGLPGTVLALCSLSDEEMGKSEAERFSLARVDAQGVSFADSGSLPPTDGEQLGSLASGSRPESAPDPRQLFSRAHRGETKHTQDAELFWAGAGKTNGAVQPEAPSVARDPNGSGLSWPYGGKTGVDERGQPLEPRALVPGVQFPSAHQEKEYLREKRPGDDPIGDPDATLLSSSPRPAAVDEHVEQLGRFLSAAERVNAGVIKRASGGIEGRSGAENGIVGALPPGAFQPFSARPVSAPARVSSGFWQTVVEQVAGEISTRIHQQSHEVLLRLEPPELGGLRIDLVLEGEKIEARMLAEVAEAATLLQAHLPELKAALRQHNLELSNVQVDINGQHGGGESPADSQQRARTYDDRVPQPVVPEWSPPATKGADSGQHGGIDLWV